MQDKNIIKTNLPILSIEERNLYNTFTFLGEGTEGKVFQKDNLAFKIFHLKRLRKILNCKCQKIELLSKLNDSSFCFPIGLLSLNNEIKGYYMPLIESGKYKNMDELLYKSNNISKMIECLCKVSNAVERLHKLGVTIGDIRPKNIMLAQNDEPIFIDTDNYSIGGYDYDLNLQCVDFLYDIYHKNFSYEDIDKFLLGILAIQPFLEGSVIESQILMQHDDAYFQNLIQYMHIDKKYKEALRLIFSDSPNKPYVGPILKRINPTERIFKYQDASKINK